MRHIHHFNRLAAASVAGLLALMGLLGSMPALAQVHLYAEVAAWANHTRLDTGQNFSDSDLVSVDGAGPFARLSVIADSDRQPNLYNGLGIAWAEVGRGGVHVYAQSQSVSSSIFQEHTVGSARATGIVTDRFGLNVPGVAAGSLFTVTAQVRIDGNAWASTLPTWSGVYNANQVAAFSYWQSWVKLSQGANGPTLAELRARQDCDHRTTGGAPLGCVGSGLTGLQTISFQIINQGPQVQLYLNASLSAGTSNYQRDHGQLLADSGADMGHTLAWAGVSELRDASGALVGNFSLLSDSSGFDYRNAYVSAVPEAPPAALLAAGLALIGMLRRRRLQDRR